MLRGARLKKTPANSLSRHATGERRTALPPSARPNTNRLRPRLSWIVGPPTIARLPVEKNAIDRLIPKQATLAIAMITEQIFSQEISF